MKNLIDTHGPILRRLAAIAVLLPPLVAFGHNLTQSDANVTSLQANTSVQIAASKKKKKATKKKKTSKKKKHTHYIDPAGESDAE